MSLELQKYIAEHAIEIIEAGAKQPGLKITDQIRLWAKMLQVAQWPSITAVWNGKPIGCWGIQIIWAGVAEAWFLAAKETNGGGLPLAEATKATLDEWIEQYSLVRVQTPLRADFPEGEKFARWLGFEFESDMPKYHPGGTTAKMYVRIITR